MNRVSLRRCIAAAAATAAVVSLTAMPSGPAGAQPANPGGFSDVAADAYYAVPVAELTARGVFAGTECDDGFCPAAPMDRKTMAVWIVRVLDGADPRPATVSRFDDVDAAGFHAPFIERMAELAITTGCGDGSGFCPDRSVTRAQMAAFISRAYELPERPDPGFSDIGADVWYSAYVARLAASGITVGCDDGTVFCPDRETTRGQMAAFLHRAETRAADPQMPESFSIPQGPRGNDTLISASRDRTCAVRLDGGVACWGRDSLRERFALAGLRNVVAISLSDGPNFGLHACALHSDGTISCWGAGGDGQLGQGDTNDYSCVGRNDAGEIGDGSTTYRDQPVRLAGITDAVAVSLAVGDPSVNPHTCALHADGSASCWGANGSGQLGDGTTDNRLVPTRANPGVTIPAEQAPTTADELLRTWMEALVQEREAQYPWMRVAWDRARDGTEAIQGGGVAGVVFHYCFVSASDFGCVVEDMHLSDLSVGTAVHELLHVYDLHTGLAPSTAWGAVQLYFATTYPGCWVAGDTHGAEILADTVSHVMVPDAWLTYYQSSSGCPALPAPSEPTAEAEQVVSQGLAGQVPDWYRDNITNGAELWAAWLRGPSLPALANLKDEFGGLCSTDWLTYPLDPQRFPPADSNPFQDGGC